MDGLRFRTAGILAGGALAFALGAAAPAQAHPHVFVDAGFAPVFEDGALAGFRVRWLFDDVYSAAVLPDLDPDGDGALSAAETAEIEGTMFAALEPYGYFTEIRAADRPLEGLTAEGFAAAIEDGRVALSFTVRLPEPVADAPVEVIGFDPEYYVDYQLDPDTLAEAAPCTMDRFERETQGYGPVEVYGLACPPARAAS